VKVVILCGGKGTRLREETEYRPKPMVPIGNRPILWHIMKIYASYGHKDFVLCLGYKGAIIKEWFRNFRWLTSDVTVRLGDNPKFKFIDPISEKDWTVTLAETGDETMTGGRIKAIEKYIGEDEEFLLTYGDGLGNVDIHSLVNFHREKKKVLTMTGVRPPGRFGEIKVENDNVVNFLEKPQASGGLINGGFFVANREIFRWLNDSPDLVFEAQPLSNLSEKNQLACFMHYGFWQPMDTFQEFLLLNKIWESGRADWKSW